MIVFLLFSLNADINTFEAQMLTARSIRFEVAIRATGAVQANYTGQVHIAGNQVTIQCEGAFMDKAVNPRLHSDGKLMVSPQGESETPADLGEAIVLGFTRQGMLHNLAVMSMGRGPDGTEGGARKRFVITPDGPTQEAQKDGKKALGFPFQLNVDDQDAARGILWVDAGTGEPFLRTQTVQFPQGAMEVEERYTHFKMDVDLAK